MGKKNIELVTRHNDYNILLEIAGRDHLFL